MKPRFEFVDDVTCADIAIRAYGDDLEALFISCASAFLSVMIENISEVASSIKKTITIKEADVEMLLFEFLQELIFIKDAESLLLLPVSLKIKQTGNQFQLTCHAAGEGIDQNKHQFSVDIKAVTMHKFEVVEREGEWCAMVIFDV